ncbi:hypothetical protein H4J02_06680 [Protaetiibacter sp. SSC-01]|uniref:hypothetical protein n=1 Tax=Protaetiibacter sp. SSC-01 TaxID=2759943 RepID=UPI001656D59E|nr:hypothetical protein [Protaetiibacter sp. SSC-01]QNO38670.1 hypothetical protein H4J02_06680 [Protaetiibacter sp. SSC-01]
MTNVQISFDLGYLELIGRPEADDASEPAPTSMAGLIASRRGGVRLATGAWLGIADVGVTVAGERPESVEAGWDVDGECSTEFTTVELVLCHPSREEMVAIRERLGRTGWHRVRAHARRRGDDVDGVALRSAEERYHLVIWPSAGDEPPALLIGEPVVPRPAPTTPLRTRTRVGSEPDDAARPLSESERADLKTASVARLREEIDALDEQIARLAARKRSLRQLVAMLEAGEPPRS